MKRVLYLAPRFHTNQYYPTRILIENGVELRFLARHTLKVENRTEVSPIILGDNILTKIIERIAGKPMDYGLPPIAKIVKEARDFKPDIAIIRVPGLYSWISLLLIRTLGIRTILYTQDIMVGGTRRSAIGKLYDRIVQPIKNCLVHCEITPLAGMKTSLAPIPSADDGICHNYLLDGLDDPHLGVFVDNPPQRCYRKPLAIKRFGISTYPTYHIPLVIEWMGEGRPDLKGLEDMRIMMVSEFQPRKRILETIDILHKLVTMGKSVHLTIIGNADRPHTKHHLEAVRSSIRESGLDSHVTIITDIPHEDVLKEYKNNHLFLLTALNEPAAYSVLEAMANGIAVITSNDNGLQECIIDGFNGFVFEKYDLEGLEDLLKVLCNDREMLLSLGANNEQVIKSLYLPRVYHDYLRYAHDNIRPE